MYVSGTCILVSVHRALTQTAWALLPVIVLSCGRASATSETAIVLPEGANHLTLRVQFEVPRDYGDKPCPDFDPSIPSAEPGSAIVNDDGQVTARLRSKKRNLVVCPRAWLDANRNGVIDSPDALGKASRPTRIWPGQTSCGEQVKATEPVSLGRVP